MLAVFVERDDLDRNVPRQRIVLELAQHGPAQHVRQEHVERNRRRLELLCQFQRFRAACCDQHLEALVAGEVDQHARIMRIVFDDQKNGVARLEIEPVVRQLLDHALLCGNLQRRRRPERRRGRRARRHRRSGIFDRQIEHERTALAGRAAQMNFAAEQARKLAADGEAEAGAAIFSAGAGVGLLEGLEDQLLLFNGNADAGVGDLEGDDGRRMAQDRMFGAPAAEGGRDAEANPAFGGELEGVRQQVLQHLLQALRVGDDAASEVGVDVDVERQLPVVRLVPERPTDGVQQVAGEDFFRIHRHRSGFDLRQIEDVADQVQQVGAGAVDGAGEFDLLARQIAVRIFGELLAEDQDAVERRAQLVRHVGEEFRLVFRRQRKFGGLFLERAARLFDFLVLALHLDVAFGQLLGLLLELFVGLLQFLLLGLQFAGELLRLFQQAFGLHRRLDRVEHDADASR